MDTASKRFHCITEIDVKHGCVDGKLRILFDGAAIHANTMRVAPGTVFLSAAKLCKIQWVNNNKEVCYVLRQDTNDGIVTELKIKDNISEKPGDRSHVSETQQWNGDIAIKHIYAKQRYNVIYRDPRKNVDINGKIIVINITITVVKKIISVELADGAGATFFNL